MRCDNCGEANPEDAAFCGSCGTSLSNTCPSCGRTADAGTRFCTDCGTDLGKSKPAVEQQERARDTPAEFEGGRYRVRRMLGEGSRKRVFLATDSRLERDVAIGLIKADGLDAPALERVKREVMTMARLGDHPNIVNVYDVSEENGVPFIVSQYMPGGSLSEEIAKFDAGQVPIEQIKTLLLSVTAGLAHAHSKSIVHRDVKPGNIWLSSDGIAQLGDFGLALATDASRLTREGMMVGTVSYMSPEQAMGGQVDARSDLYSLGCVAYELVTGRPPFIGDDPVAIVTQHLNTPPVAPSWHRADTPKELEAVILDLLAKDPDKRPKSASEVTERLKHVALVPSDPVEQTENHEPMYRRTFIGREQEVTELQEAFNMAVSGTGSLAMVVGEPGIGKTSICEQLATYVGIRGGRTLVGHCYEEGSLTLPYLPFVEAIRTYVITHDADDLRKELASAAGQIARIVPEVTDRIQVQPYAGGDAEVEGYRLLQAVSGFLANASSIQPILLVLEDLHEADKGTLEMLTFLARNLEGTRLLVVGTYRDVEVDRTHPLSGALAELRRTPHFRRIPLRGLTPDEVQRMMSAIANQSTSWSLAEAVHGQTEGNPLFVQEVLRYLVEEGLIKREAGRWQATGDSPLTSRIPEGLRDVIGKRISRLSRECNKLLQIAAVIGRDFQLATLVEVSDIDEEQLLEFLEEALKVAVIEDRSRGGDIRYRFTHAFFRQTLYEEMIAPRRLKLHQEIARALEKQYAKRLSEHAAELAEHFSHSSSQEDLAKAVEYGRLAARRSAEVFAHGETARLIQQALEVQEVLDPEDLRTRAEMLLDLSDALMPAGEPKRVYDEVAELAYALAKEIGDQDLMRRAGLIAYSAVARYGGAALLYSGEWQRWGERIVANAIPETRDGVLATLIRMWDAAREGRLEEGKNKAIEALAMARRINDPEAIFLSSIPFVGLSGSWFQDRPKAQYEVAQDLLQAPREGVSARLLGVGLGGAALLLHSWGELEKAEEIVAEVEALGERTQDPQLTLIPYMLRANIVEYEGRLEEAIAIRNDMKAKAEEMGSPVLGVILAGPSNFMPLILIGRAEEALDDLLQAMEDLKLPLFPFKSLVLACIGRRQESLEEVEKTLRQDADQIGLNERVAFLLETAKELGDADLAKRLFGLMTEDAMALDPDTPQAVNGLIFGPPLRLVGDLERSRSMLEVAERWFLKIGNRVGVALSRFELARTLLEAAGTAGASQHAASHLDFAIKEFREMKIVHYMPLAIRMRMELQGVTGSEFVTSSIDAVANRVERDKPALDAHTSSKGEITILFTDIENSTLLVHELGDEQWMQLLKRHNDVVRRVVARYDGHEVDNAGDGFMIVFDDPHKGLECAVEIQSALQESGPHPSLKVRAGLHTGTVLRDKKNLYGREVHLAARVGASARGGEIAASEAFVGATGADRFDEGEAVTLKGFEEAQRIHRLIL